MSTIIRCDECKTEASELALTVSNNSVTRRLCDLGSADFCSYTCVARFAARMAHRETGHPDFTPRDCADCKPVRPMYGDVHISGDPTPLLSEMKRAGRSTGGLA